MAWTSQRSNDIVYLTIPKWAELGTDVVFSTRIGGVSDEPYTSLNMAFHVNDEAEKVITNRTLLLNQLGSSMEECAAGEQVHGKRVMLVTVKDKGRGMKEQQTAFPACDGLITRESIGLMAFYADCVPLYFFNPVEGLIGLAHAGWQGTIQDIVHEVVAEMKLLGGAPEDCLAAIGPCIGSCCYEVGENVASSFCEKFNEDQVLKRNSDGKYQLDLVKANEILLLSSGIHPENISIAHRCTCCNPVEFYSYRRDGLTGRMAAYIRKKVGD